MQLLVSDLQYRTVSSQAGVNEMKKELVNTIEATLAADEGCIS
jgi:hypothetical protein